MPFWKNRPTDKRTKQKRLREELLATSLPEGLPETGWVGTAGSLSFLG